MPARSVTLLCLLLGACHGDNLNLGDGHTPAADGGAGRPAADAAPQVPEDSGAQPATSEPLDFEPPRVIAELESEDVSDDDPSLTADLLALCFNSKRDGGKGAEDIWCSRRTRSDENWGAPVAQVALNTEHRETGIALSLDGLSVWFSSDRDESGLDVYTANRTTRDAAWSEPTRVPELSSADDELVSSVDETGLRMMLARRTHTDSDDDDNDYDIVISQRATHNDPWQAPIAVAELNTGDGESDAFLVGSGLDLLFTRNDDLMLARRQSTSAAFDQIMPLQVLNSDKRERDPWSNSAFTYIVFSSDRAGSFRLYESRRTTN